MEKVCTKCGVTKTSKWYSGPCCSACYSRQANSGRRLYSRAYAKAYRQKHPTYNKQVHLRREYGLTLEDYTSLLQKQQGLCAICLQPDPARKGSTYFAVDHCHKTGIIRGLLCSRCNRALGFFKDDPDIMARAITYIRTYENRS